MKRIKKIFSKKKKNNSEAIILASTSSVIEQNSSSVELDTDAQAISKAQEWLDRNYPKKKRNAIKEIDIKHKDLAGALDLSDFVNLEILNCWDNQLTTLILDNCLKLKWIDFWDNNLQSDLSFLKNLVNLKTLGIRNNLLIGSLEPLKNMNKLKRLEITDTDIDSGLEYLPDSVEDFWCLAKDRKNAKCKNIYNLFANDQGKVETHSQGTIISFSQKLQAWKKANPELVSNAQQIIELEKTLNNLNLALVNGKIENEKISKGLDIFQFETEEIITETKKQNQDYYQAQIIHNPFKTN